MPRSNPRDPIRKGVSTKRRGPKEDFNYLTLCPQMRLVADALRGSDFEEDRAVADYLDSKLNDLLDASYKNLWNLRDPERPLSETERRVMLYRYFRAMRTKEIASVLKLDQQYVSNVISSLPRKYFIGREEFFEAGGRLR